MAKRLALLALLAFAPLGASAEFLYGVTATDLVEIDPTDPSQVRTIGPHGITRNVAYLAWDPVAERMFGLATEDVSGGGPLIFDYDLVEYDVATGAGSTVHNLGRTDSGPAFEALDYVESQNMLVVSTSTPPSFVTDALQTLDPDTGTLTPLATVGIDNDFGVYDDVRDLFYVWDPNSTARIQIVDLGSGALTDVGPTATDDRDGAFSEEDGGLFLYNVDTDELVNVQTTDGGAPATRVSLGVVAGDAILGLAFTPVPEPASPALLFAGLAPLAAAHRARRGARRAL